MFWKTVPDISHRPDIVLCHSRHVKKPWNLPSKSVYLLNCLVNTVLKQITKEDRKSKYANISVQSLHISLTVSKQRIKMHNFCMCTLQTHSREHHLLSYRWDIPSRWDVLPAYLCTVNTLSCQFHHKWRQ